MDNANNERKELKPYVGIIIFVVFMALFLTLGARVQQAYGLWGVGITEAAMLLYAIGCCLITKQSLKEVFPLKKTSFRQVGGVILFGLGAGLCANLSNMVIMYFFPASYQESAAVNMLYTTVPLFWAIVIMSVMPGICEEALHRGMILHTMKPIRKDAVIILIMGVIFGLFHVSIYRFLPTAVLGAALTYIMLKTKNFLLPALFHFLNNFSAVMLAMLSTTMLNNIDTSAVTITAANVGAYLIIGAAAPFLLLKGSEMLKGKKNDISRGIYLPEAADIKSGNKAVGICFAIAAVMLISGFLLIKNNMPIL